MSLILHLRKSQRRVGYVQEKVRPCNGREAGLGHERYIAGEHMDVRRDCVSFARRIFFGWEQTVRNELHTLRKAGRNSSRSLHSGNEIQFKWDSNGPDAVK